MTRTALKHLFVALAFLLTGPAASRAATLAERAAAIDAPAGGEALTLSAPLRVGRAEISPAPGTRVRTLVAQGTPCGVVFEGPARLRYLVEDRFSAPVVQRNARKSRDLILKPAGQGVEMTVELDGAVVWGWGLSQESGAGSGMAMALPDWAAKLLAGRRFSPPSHLLLDAEANGVSGARYALLRGQVTDLRLHVDPRTGEEVLSALAKGTDPGTTFREGIWLRNLSSQPIGRTWWDKPEADLIAEHEKIAIENPAGEQLRIVSLSRLRAQRKGAALWHPDLVDRLFDHLGKVHWVKVTSVRVDGRATDFLHGDDGLLVPLGRALAEKETVEVEVTYEGEMALRPSAHSYWVLGTWPWYPRQDLAGEKATIEITVNTPEGWTPYASGTEVSRTMGGGRNRLSTKIEQPMQFAVVTAGKYRAIEDTQAGLTCRAATYAMLNEGPARELIARFFLGRGFFEQLFGEPYPFREVAMVEINDWGFGQAPPGILFFTKEFYTAPVGSRRLRVYFQDLNARYMHEVAHGWWGNVVKMNSVEEIWLSEAFSDYTAALALWQLRKDRGEYEMKELVKDWFKAANEIRPGASLYLNYRMALLDEIDAGDRWRLTYAKGPLVIHALRLELQRQKGSEQEGDRYFIALMRSYINRSRYGWGTTRGLIETLNELTGTDWQPWFERYVYGTEVPKVPV